MGYARFLYDNRLALGFGLLFTFFGSFGQTFLISLYLPALTSHFALSDAAFGNLYSAATLSSAALLAFVGRKIDHYPLRSYSLFVVLFLAAGMVLMAIAWDEYSLFFGLLATRLAGQGLMVHVSLTAISRYFVATRGKAMGLTTIGSSLGEAFFPAFTIFWFQHGGWQTSMYAGIALMLVVMLPYCWYATTSMVRNHSPEPSHSLARQWTQLQVLRSKYFWLVAPNVFMMTMVATAVFFYHLPLATLKGWSHEWFALCFTFYAAARLLSSIWAGALIDRYRAQLLFPLYLFPYILGMLLMWGFDGSWVLLSYLVLTGVSFGFGATIRGAILVELYGAESIGTVRAVFSTLLVFGTAMGPVFYASLMQATGLNVEELLPISILLMIISSAFTFNIYRAFPYRKWRHQRRLQKQSALQTDIVV